MSYWNYRVLRTRDDQTDTDSYEIHEVYYGDDGRIQAWTANPVGPYGISLEELRTDIEYVMEATRKPVLKVVRRGEKEVLIEAEESS